MKQREKILAISLGALGVVIGGNWLFNQLLQGPLNARYAKVENLRDEIEKKEFVLRRARRAGQRLTEWQTMALPAETEMARSLYQNWLLEVVSAAGFEQPNVDSGDSVTKQGIYQRLPFSFRGRGTLEQLTDFLFQFYRAGHLHQIQRLSITPVANSPSLDLTMTIEALVLPEANRRDRLTSEVSNRLVKFDRQSYQAIVERDIFGQGGPNRLDPADYAFLTAILESDGQPEAWLTVRTTGEVLKLHLGQQFEVGQFRGSVSGIDELDLVIDSDQERWLLTLGESLTQATALPPEY